VGDDAHKDLLRRVSRVLWMPEHSPRQVVDGSLNLDDQAFEAVPATTARFGDECFQVVFHVI
jgi:hypothetical protein